jgi:hypothetical protein
MALSSDQSGSGGGGMSSLQKGSIGILGFAGLGGILAIFRDDWVAMLIVLGGVLAVALLLAGYVSLLKWWNKRKAAPLRQALIDNSTASPNAINEPARRAKLDALRQSFETGVAKFQAAGKDLYKLPWYLLVGAPGSGKTEAIRNCSIGFPPGLQDTLQGTGGTLNMNWWFTNEGVILDTAGRLMFEEVQPGSTSEWTEFLGMLNKYRSNCPINGMMLVIPADSLIRDNADVIQRNAGRIAQQFDSIQRALGVRFPVFVLITKCDLVNGFREFFDTLSDPQLQHQMLGWSNPSPLDAPFDPEQVDKHLSSVRERLLRRRFGLLIDPVHTEDPNGRRIEQVDALYAFPDSLVQLAPRLRRYLEMIFTTNEWSPKPLFLRGIYFTSAMREGSALDAELAQMLRVPVESLPEGRIWQRERSFFLRDLFLKKVYRESGLVTRASNTRHLQRRRRLAILGTGFAAIAVFTLFTVLGAQQLGESIGSHAAFWSRLDGAVEAPGTNWSLIRDGKWVEETYPFGRERKNLSALLVEAASRTGEIPVPPIFAPARLVVRNIEPEKREAALRKLFATGVLRPGVEQARARMKVLADARRRASAATAPNGASRPAAEPWSDRAADALAQLLWIESLVAGVEAPAASDRGAAGESAMASAAGDAAPEAAADDGTGAGGDQAGGAPAAAGFGVRLRSLYDFALDDRGADLSTLDGQLQPIYDRLYGAAKPGAARAALIREDCGSDLTVVQDGVTTFLEYWRKQIEGQNPTVSSIDELQQAVQSFADAEDKLHRFAAGRKFDDATYAKTIKEWQELVGEVRRAAEAVDQRLTEAREQSGGAWNDQQPMVKAYEAEQTKMRAAARRQSRRLITLLAGVDQKDDSVAGVARSIGGSSGDTREALRTLRNRLTEKSKAWTSSSVPDSAREYRNRLAHLDSTCLAPVGAEPAFKARVAAYLDANERIPKPGKETTVDPIAILEIGKTMKEALQPLEESAKRLDELPARSPLAEPAKRTCEFALSQLAAPALRQQQFEAVLEPLFNRRESIESIAERCAAMPNVAIAPMLGPKLPMTALAEGGRLEARFHPELVKKLSGAVATVQEEIGKGSTSGGAALAHKARAVREQALPQYYAAYVKYWTDTVPSRLEVRQYNTWQEYQRDLASVRAETENAELRRVFRVILEALASVPPEARSKDFERTVDDITRLKDGLDDRMFVQRTIGLVAAWSRLDLGQGATQTRGQLLAMTPEQFRLKYLAPEGMPYWRDVVQRGVSLLTQEMGKAAGAKAQDFIKQYGGRFPLAPPRRGRNALTLDEIESARALLREIGSARAPAAAGGAGAAAAAAAETLGQNGRFDDPDLNAMVDALRGTGLDPRYQQVLDALGSKERPLQCTIWIIDRGVSDKYPYVRLQEGARGGWASIRGRPKGEAVELNTILMPGSSLKLEFRTPQQNADKADAWKAPDDRDFHCLYALHERRARQPSENKSVWEFDDSVKDEMNKDYLYTIRIEFKGRPVPFPSLDQWPDAR